MLLSIAYFGGPSRDQINASSHLLWVPRKFGLPEGHPRWEKLLGLCGGQNEVLSKLLFRTCFVTNLDATRANEKEGKVTGLPPSIYFIYLSIYYFHFFDPLIPLFFYRIFSFFGSSLLVPIANPRPFFLPAPFLLRSPPSSAAGDPRPVVQGNHFSAPLLPLSPPLSRSSSLPSPFAAPASGRAQHPSSLSLFPSSTLCSRSIRLPSCRLNRRWLWPPLIDGITDSWTVRQNLPRHRWKQNRVRKKRSGFGAINACKFDRTSYSLWIFWMFSFLIFIIFRIVCIETIDVMDNLIVHFIFCSNFIFYNIRTF